MRDSPSESESVEYLINVRIYVGENYLWINNTVTMAPRVWSLRVAVNTARSLYMCSSEGAPRPSPLKLRGKYANVVWMRGPGMDKSRRRWLPTNIKERKCGRRSRICASVERFLAWRRIERKKKEGKEKAWSQDTFETRSLPSWTHARDVNRLADYTATDHIFALSRNSP